tara:strand:- start:398 stop:541 length:144 start_codon:yes stop_codon:yes gene_type:complete
VFSVDSILTAISMTEVIAVGIMFLAAGQVTSFVYESPTDIVLALVFC